MAVESASFISANPISCEVRQLRPFLRRHAVFLIILAIGLALRLAALYAYLATHEWKGETWEYEVIAQNLLGGKGFTVIFNDTIYESFTVPVFPFICYMLHLIWGPGLGLYYIFHIAVAGGVIALTYVIAKRFFCPTVGLLAALLVALEPGLVAYQSYKVDVVAFATFLMLVGLWVFLRLAMCFETRLAIMLGLLLGIGVLTRPDLMALGGLLPLWLALQRQRSDQIIRLSLIIVIISAFIVVPWAIRNYAVHRQFVLFTTVTGEWLWRGNNPNATGTSVTLDIHSQFESASTEFRNKILSSKELQQDALFRAEAIRYIRDEPGGFIWRSLQKVYYFWWFTPTFAVRYYEWAPPLILAIYRVFYAVVLFFLLLGFWLMARNLSSVSWRITLYLLMIPISVSIIHGITYVEGRHRVLVMPIILILSAHGMVALKNISRLRRYGA